MCLSAYRRAQARSKLDFAERRFRDKDEERMAYRTKMEEAEKKSVRNLPPHHIAIATAPYVGLTCGPINGCGYAHDGWQTLLARRCHAAETLAASLDVQLRAVQATTVAMPAVPGIASRAGASNSQPDYSYKPAMKSSPEVTRCISGWWSLHDTSPKAAAVCSCKRPCTPF